MNAVRQSLYVHVHATKNFRALLIFTEKFEPLNMTKNYQLPYLATILKFA